MVSDSQALAERVGLIHIMSSRQDGFPGLVVFADDLPQENSGLRIEASRFGSSKNAWGSCIMARAMKPLHHASGKAADHLVRAFRELEFFEQSVRAFIPSPRSNSEVGSVEGEDLAGSQSLNWGAALQRRSDA